MNMSLVIKWIGPFITALLLIWGAAMNLAKIEASIEDLNGDIADLQADFKDLEAKVYKDC